MIWLLSRLVVWPVKAVFVTGSVATKATAKTAGGSARLGYRAGRLVGYGRITTVLVGVAIGLLLAPVPGAELRRRLAERLGSRPVPPAPVPASTVPGPNGQGAWRPDSPTSEPAPMGDPGTNPAP